MKFGRFLLDSVFGVKAAVRRLELVRLVGTLGPSPCRNADSAINRSRD